MFSKLGLQGSGDLLGNTAVMPAMYSGPVSEQSMITAPRLGSLRISKRSCLIRPSGAGEAPKDCSVFGKPYDVYYVWRSPVGSTGPRSDEHIPCRQPREIESCNEILKDQLPPYIAEVQAFIRDSQPELARRMQGLRSGFAEQADSEREVQKKFAADLNSGTAGELFALADELQQRGDVPRAREALRALLSRFPDHKLAITASQLLSNLQGK